MEDTEIFIVTARVIADRDSTVAELDSLGIDYDRLFMKENSSVDSVEFKKSLKIAYVTFNLLEQGIGC